MADVLLSKSNYWKMASINAALRGIPFTPPSQVYVALYTSAPTDSDTGQEVVGGGYARRPVTFSAPVVQDRRAVVASTSDVVFPIASAKWGLITHVGIRDAAAGGNLIYHGAITTPRTAETNDTLRFLAGQLKVNEG
ncbi:phage tail fiber protein [Paenibacillus polymyxa]|uniref:Uncharacterized protein n=1 Tax=Paenibacillus polymyxa TaxID=1406 RepID=A0ABX2ZE11_PAEPO|nr:hypothetical protein [Paenibacillus polymyxa]ODA09248.1 hypothetical protein A7312_26695 [Paenibacillus polymyxa]